MILGGFSSLVSSVDFLSVLVIDLAVEYGEHP